jgi:hypothetical protein
MARLILLLLASTATLQLPGAAAAQTASASQKEQIKLSKSDRTAILKGLKAFITKEYVDPKRRASIVAGLLAKEREGRYELEDPKEFATRVKDDLTTIGQDGHLGLYYSPSFAARLQKAAAGEERPRPEASLLPNARRANHGVREMRVYPGNIRYLHLDSFERWAGEESVRAYDHAMQFLAGGDAIIVDMRGNGGGSAEAYSYFESHFVEPNLPLFTSVLRGVKGEEVRAVDKLPAGRLTGKPLWVLSDAKVASATEAFLYDVRHRNLGTIVGQKSAGAANHNDYFPLPKGFVASISIGGPIMAATGGNWERAGVAPHVETPPELALKTALLLATEKVASMSPPELKAQAEKEVQKLTEELRQAKAAQTGGS